MRVSMTGRTLARGGFWGMILGSGLLVAGCANMDGRGSRDDPDLDNARQQLLQKQAEREAAMVKSQIAGLDQAQDRLVERLDRLETLTRENAKMREDLVAMRRELNQVRAEREALRKEIVDDLTVRINKYMASVAAATTANQPTPQVKNGWMHTVVAGQKLTDIAKAYKSTSAVIRKANNLKDDNLKAGQTLFIPE